MTLEEAKKIARIAGYADGGCDHCVGDLVERLNKDFPEFVFSVGGAVAASEDNDWQSHMEVFVKLRGEI